MTLVYYVKPENQHCDPVEGAQPFVSKADWDEANEEISAAHEWFDRNRTHIAELAGCKKVRDEWCAEYVKQRDGAIALAQRYAAYETAIRMVITRIDDTALANELRSIMRRNEDKT
jgi:hypothetical protein